MSHSERKRGIRAGVLAKILGSLRPDSSLTLGMMILLLALPLSAATEKRMKKPVAGRSTAANQRTVTLDVKDAEVRDILKAMQKQCGIKNVVVDPEVQVKGTFYFERLPCRTAFSVVFRTLGLDATNYPNSVITASPRR